jgi:dTMP kinase
MLVAFEGIDGSGKATQIAKLTSYLKLKGRKSRVIAYPDMHGPLGLTLGEVIHGHLNVKAEAQFFLFLADILRDQAKPDGRLNEEMELKVHDVIILDRYCASTIAYQKCKGMDGKRAEQIVAGWKPVAPDLMILLDLDAAVGMRRKHAQKEPDEFERDAEFQAKVRKEFLALAKKKAIAKRWVVVDASGTPEQVAERVRAEIDKLIK